MSRTDSNPPHAPHQAHGLQIPRPPATPWLAVAGAKGGVGKTMLATNVALLLARSGHRTLLVDFDPGCGNVGVYLRLSAPHDLDDVAIGTVPVRDAIVDGPGGIRVLLGRSGPTALTGDDDSARQRALRAITDAARDFDVVVVDTGAGIGPATMAVATRAELVLSVTTPDAAALTDAYALAKLLHLRGRSLPTLVVNRTKSREDAMRTAAKLNAVSRKFLGTTASLCGWIGEDVQVELSIQDQRPLALFGQGQGIDDLRSITAAALAALPPLTRRATGALASRAPRTVALRPGN
jgi:flagellar biosynthesis protein FlhG